MTAPLITRFAGLRRSAAVIILLGTVAAILGCLAVSLTAGPDATGTMKEGQSDWDFYRAVTERVRAGQSYYDALPELFPKFHFKPFSIFNYRTPTYAWLIGGLPSEGWAQALLAGLALLTMVLAFLALRREINGPMAAGGTFLLLGGLGWCFIPLGVYAQELWAGTFITMSSCLYVLGRWPLAVLAGLAALFFRELTLPYCLLALGFAAWQRRPAEIAAWLGGLALYGAFMVWHLARVSPLLPQTHSAGVLGWVTFGGVPFLLDTSRMNFALLVFVPAWTTAIFLPMAILGLVGWPSELGARVWLTVAAYLAAFSVVGLPVNKYWGLMDAPLLGLGLLWAPLALRDLWRAICGVSTLFAAQTADHATDQCSDDKSCKDSGEASH